MDVHESPSETQHTVSCTERKVDSGKQILKDDLKCVVDGHSDIASEPMLSTGEVQRQVHGRNKDAITCNAYPSYSRAT